MLQVQFQVLQQVVLFLLISIHRVKCIQFLVKGPSRFNGDELT